MSDYATLRRMMVDTQVRPSDVTEFPIIDAMLSVPREAFVSPDQAAVAYRDGPVAFDEGREMLEPRSFAKLLEALDIDRNDLVLDLGACMGYSSAVIAHIAEAVIAVEEMAQDADDIQSLLTEHHADNVAMQQGPLVAGAPEHGPYDVIVIEGGVQHVPASLLDQLKDGGRIGCIFVDQGLGKAKIGHKVDGKVNWRFAFDASAPVLPGFEKEVAFAF